VLEKGTLAQVEVGELLNDVILLLLQFLDQILGKGGREGGRKGEVSRRTINMKSRSSKHTHNSL
jgi:hypothetical protein